MHKAKMKNIKLKFVCLTFVIVFMLLNLLYNSSLAVVFAADSEVDSSYVNPTTGYEAVIIDEAELLTEGEEASLHESMNPITEYGNVVFLSLNTNNMEAEDKAKLEESARADEKVKTFTDGKDIIKVIVIPKTHLVNIVVK